MHILWRHSLSTSLRCMGKEQVLQRGPTARSEKVWATCLRSPMASTLTTDQATSFARPIRRVHVDLLWGTTFARMIGPSDINVTFAWAAPMERLGATRQVSLHTSRNRGQAAKAAKVAKVAKARASPLGRMSGRRSCPRRLRPSRPAAFPPLLYKSRSTWLHLRHQGLL